MPAVPPAIDCAASDITPPDAGTAAAEFTATATDVGSGVESVEITAYDCYKYTKKSKRVDKAESCAVSIDGATISILDSGGVGDNITWTVVATDEAGNTTTETCEIVVLNPGKGGRVFHRRERKKRAKSLAHKLFQEAELSLGVATSLSEALAQEIVVHVDANEDIRHKSSNYVQALAGMVVGHGFKVQVKPNSWCATHVADHVVKERHERAA